MKKWLAMLVTLTTIIALIISGVILVGAQGGSEIDIPTKISYQGYLEDGDDPVTQNNIPMGFALYESASGGSPVWEEVQSVDVDNGLFDVLLGSGSPIASGDFDSDRYLGISVNGDPEMTPRQQLVSVAYAFWADRANISSSAYSLQAPDGYPEAAVYVDIEGNVGIGTGSPSAKLDVVGNIQVGTTTVTCDSNTEGTIRFDSKSKTIEVCNGTEWLKTMMYGPPGPIGSNEFFPDGFESITLINQGSVNSVPYTVPSGKNLYITHFHKTVTDPVFLYLDGNVFGRLPYSSNLSEAYQPPLIATEGQVISSNVDELYFHGFLIDPYVTPVTQSNLNTSPYTIPSGRILYIGNSSTSGVSTMYIDGCPVFSPRMEWQWVNPHIIVGAEQVLSSDNDLFVINGYLVDN